MLCRAQLGCCLVDELNYLLTKGPTFEHHAEMRTRIRPPPQPPRDELIALRQKYFPGVLQKDVAKMLGITRLHLIAVEQGYRRPSTNLVLRWLELLAPDARLSMFGDVPATMKRFEEFFRLQKNYPKIFKAAA
jgi:hypothetical protein